MNIFPHFLYGPGEDALALTEEYGAKMDENYTQNIFEEEKYKKLCQNDGNSMTLGQLNSIKKTINHANAFLSISVRVQRIEPWSVIVAKVIMRHKPFYL